MAKPVKRHFCPVFKTVSKYMNLRSRRTWSLQTVIYCWCPNPKQHIMLPNIPTARNSIPRSHVENRTRSMSNVTSVPRSNQSVNDCFVRRDRKQSCATVTGNMKYGCDCADVNSLRFDRTRGSITDPLINGPTRRRRPSVKAAGNTVGIYPYPYPGK